MRKQLIVANWKMFGSLETNQQRFDGLLAGFKAKPGVEMVICPPDAYLIQAMAELADSAIVLGAQNIHERDEGAYTGGISAPMCADLGATYAIVGHSERRTHWNESDEQVAEKFAAALRAGLFPILCVGENLEQRDAGQALEVIDRQLKVVCDKVGVDAFKCAAVAYEPLWAIGTGKVASLEQIEQVHRHLRKVLGKYAESTSVLYGGSVKADNAARLFASREIDGALVGGASLIAEEFLAIYKAAKAAGE